MNSLKISTAVIVVICLCAIISHGFFFLEKPSNANQVSITIIEDDDIDRSCIECNNVSQFYDNQSGLLVDVAFVKPIDKNDYSFMTMPVFDNYQMDYETRKALKTLIGNDIDQFVKIVLQSNNNIIAKQACRSCSMYSLFKKIKKNKQIAADDLVVLQKMLANLYQFIENMNKLSSIKILQPEQIKALEDLHMSESKKNSLKLQARKAAASVTLKKLQTITST